MGLFDKMMAYARQFKREAGVSDEQASDAARQSPRERELLSELARAVEAQGTGPSAPVRYALHFSGEVQFVGFRYTNMRLANERGLTGWVHNEDDGTVTMEIQGPPATLGAHLGMLHAYYSNYGNLIWLETAEAQEPRADEEEFTVADPY